MRQTTMINSQDVKKTWYIIDASGLILGRLATKVASILRGKHKATFTSHVDCGDNIIIINAHKVILSGNKLNNKKYYNHSGFVGGMRVRTAKVMQDKYPIEMVERTIKGMLPHTSLGRKQAKNLFVYDSEKHPHSAQMPKLLVLQEEGS
jgi:large subunit ribosomal protein L13